MSQEAASQQDAVYMERCPIVRLALVTVEGGTVLELHYADGVVLRSEPHERITVTGGTVTMSGYRGLTMLL